MCAYCNSDRISSTQVVYFDPFEWVSCGNCAGHKLYMLMLLSYVPLAIPPISYYSSCLIIINKSSECQGQILILTYLLLSYYLFQIKAFLRLLSKYRVIMIIDRS